MRLRGLASISRRPKRKDTRRHRTEAEVGRVEARTRIKAGAPVCSGCPLCSPADEPRIGPLRRLCGKATKRRLLPFRFQSLLSIVTFSGRTSGEPLIPIRLSPSLPPCRSAPCHISPLQQNKATPPSGVWRQPTDFFYTDALRRESRQEPRGGAVSKQKTGHFNMTFVPPTLPIMNKTAGKTKRDALLRSSHIYLNYCPSIISIIYLNTFCSLVGLIACVSHSLGN